MHVAADFAFAMLDAHFTGKDVEHIQCLRFPDQPAGGAGTSACWRAPDSICGVHARCGVGSSVAPPTRR